MNTKTKHIAGASLGLLTLVGQAGAETVGYEKYIYDASGNIVEKQIDDQVTRFDYEGNILKADSTGTAYRHDSAGRLVAETGTRGAERELAYQFGDKVTWVAKNGTTTELFYNAEGQLVGSNSSGQTEAFAWDGLGLVMRGDRTYANENHVVGGIPTLARNEIFVSDIFGSTLRRERKNFNATAFGEGLEAGFFTGKPFIEELEGFAFRHRNYSSDNGRWITPDPAGFPDGTNRYAYINSDPGSGVDPNGLEQVTLTAAWTKEIGGAEFSGSASTFFNYTFVVDSQGQRRLDTHDFVGDPSYLGTVNVTDYQSSDDPVYDLDDDGVPETHQVTKIVYGPYVAKQLDKSGLLIEKKVIAGVTHKADKAFPKLWIEESKETSLGYYDENNDFVLQSGPTDQVFEIDFDEAEFFGDWIEQ